MLDANVIIRKNRKTKNLYLRIKANGAQLGEVSTGLYCNPVHWLGDRWCKVSGKVAHEDRTQNTRVNKELEKQVENFRQAWDKLHELGQSDINLSDLKLGVSGQHPLMGYNMKRLGIDEALEYYVEYGVKPFIKNWAHAKNHLSILVRMIKEVCGDDVSIDQVTEQHAHEVYRILSSKKYCYQGINKKYAYKTRKLYIGRIKLFYSYWFKHRNRLTFTPVLPESNPFDTVEVIKLADEPKSRINKETHFYKPNEIEEIQNVRVTSPQNYYRNILLWQIYTGVAFVDIASFDPDAHIEVDMDGEKWMSLHRKKTGVLCEIPFEPEAERLLEYFKTNKPPIKEGEAVLINPGSMKTYRRFLDTIGRFAGFNLQATHKARHTFAVNMLEKGYHMEEVSRMMGHSTMQTTMNSYGFVTRNRMRSRRKQLRQGHLFVSPVSDDLKTGTH